jgi:hypothetical protein
MAMASVANGRFVDDIFQRSERQGRRIANGFHCFRLAVARGEALFDAIHVRLDLAKRLAARSAQQTVDLLGEPRHVIAHGLQVMLDFVDGVAGLVELLRSGGTFLIGHAELLGWR